MIKCRKAVAISYLNKDIKTVDVETLKKQTGVDCYLLVDYDSREQYECIENPYYNIAGRPLDGLGIIKYLPYINEYRMTGQKEDTYVNCEKQVIDNILIITQKQGEKVSLKTEKEEMFDSGDKITTDQVLEYIYQKNIVDEGKEYAKITDAYQEKQVSDTYILNTESQQIYIYIPVEQLNAEGVDVEDLYIRAYRNNNVTINTSTWITDDEKYIFLIVPLIMLAGIVIATFAGDEPITEETKMGLIMIVGVFAFIMLYVMLLLKIRKKKDVTKYTRDNVLSLLRTDEEVDRFDQQMMAAPVKNVKFSNINNLFLTEDYVGMDSVFGGDLKYLFVRKTDVAFIRFRKTASTTGNSLNAAFLFDVLNKANKIILQGCADSGKQLEEVIELLQMAQPDLQIIK